jgi:hypothetical protein
LNKRFELNFPDLERKSKRKREESEVVDIVFSPSEATSTELVETSPSPSTSTGNLGVIRMNPGPSPRKSKLRVEKCILEHELDQLKIQNTELIKQLEYKSCHMTFNEIKHDDRLVSFYTGLPSTEVFIAVLDIVKLVKFKYVMDWSVLALKIEDQLLLTLMKLRQNFKFLDLAVRFGVSATTCKNVFKSLMVVLHRVFFVEAIEKRELPSVAKNNLELPECFKPFPQCRIILDATEVEIDIPKNLDQNKLTFSNYKQRNTFKGLVGIAPSNAVIFVSELFPGSVSDKELTRQSKVLEKVSSGDLILADKGFTIHGMLPGGVDLNIPPFLFGRQFSEEQVKLATKIAGARIHVERVIQRIKTF